MIFSVRIEWYLDPASQESPVISGTSLRVCSKTIDEQETRFEQKDPHPSDGGGNSQTRLSQLPKRLDTPTDGGRFSLSHPMGEGLGERGEGARKSEVVFARVLSTHERRDGTLCGFRP